MSYIEFKNVKKEYTRISWNDVAAHCISIYGRSQQKGVYA